MPTITVGSGTGLSVLNYTTNDSLAFSLALAQTITTNEANGTYTNFNFSGTGSLAPQPASGTGGDVTFMQPTQFGASGNPIAVLVPTGDLAIIDAAVGPLSIQGGAAGGIFLAGSGLAGSARNVTYTNITPSGTATDLIGVLGGNNLLQTSTVGGGNYNFEAGPGNDTINALTGNSTINAGTGTNQINLGTGANFVYSEGYDTITGSTVGGGADTVFIGSGQTSINTGASGFIIDDASPNPLQVKLGSGADTVNFGGAGIGTFSGTDSSATVSGLGTVLATEVSTGDFYSVTGGANITVNAAGGNVTVNGIGTSGQENFTAGSGNDTLYAGQGPATLGGALGGNASALLVSGGTAPTTFSFVNGQGGGSDSISGLKSTDVLSFAGYGPNPQGTAISAAGGSIITLGDGTTIHLLGVSTAQLTTQPSRVV